jgi:hypothetical protein
LLSVASSPTVTIDTDFGLTAPVDVYAVTETEVGETPVGSATSDGRGKLTIAVTDIVAVGSLHSFGGYVAVPVFATGQILPTIDHPVTASLGTAASAPLALSNGAPTIAIAPAVVTPPVEGAEFPLNATFTSTHLDDLTVQIDYSATGASFVDRDTAAPAAYGILTLPVPAVSATINGSLASYAALCTFTAPAFAPDAASSAATLDVLLASDILASADIPVPAPLRDTVPGTNITLVLTRDDTVPSPALSALLAALARALRDVDNTPSIHRFYQITQTQAGPALTVAATLTGITTADPTDVAAMAEDAAAATRYTAESVMVASADIPRECVGSCGDGDCGRCLDGRACTRGEQCFSDECLAAVCYNAAGATTVTYTAVAAAVAMLLLMC